MNAQLERAFLLQRQQRPADAERELRAALAQDPQDAVAHAAVAECLISLHRLAEAHGAAAQAIALAPDMSLVHHIMARVLLERNDFDPALKSAATAIELDNEDADNYALQSAILLSTEKWSGALKSDEDALSLDPEHAEALNYRAIAQVHLGQGQAAARTIHGALQRDPENSMTHAAHGWSMLHANQPKAAQEHFREALRLNPENEYARSGMVEAIKAHNPVYRVMLAYFLWMARLNKGARWGVVIGLYIGQRLLLGAAELSPQTRPVAWVIGGVYFLFLFTTWLAGPVSNLLLRLHPLGKHALSRDQRVGANATGAVLAVVPLGIVAGLITGLVGFYVLAGLSLLLAIPVSAIMICDRGWPRTVCLLISLVLGGGTVFTTAMVMILAYQKGAAAETTERLAWAGAGISAVGCFISSWVNNWLMAVKPRR